MLVCTTEMTRYPSKLICSLRDGSEVYKIRPVRDVRTKHVQYKQAGLQPGGKN